MLLANNAVIFKGTLVSQTLLVMSRMRVKSMGN